MIICADHGGEGLIVKLVGGFYSYRFMYARLAQKWAPKKDWQLIDLENNYFLARFKSDEDKNFALTGGPWMIAGKYVVVQSWKPTFCPMEESINKMAVWIRISSLPLEFLYPELLTKIGNKLGTTFKVDINTSNQERGRFARLCVEIDLSAQVLYPI